MLTWAVDQQDGPVAIRYPRGGDRGYSESGWNGIASAVCHRSGTDATILTYGTMLENAEICLPEAKHVLIAEEAIAGMAAELAYHIQKNSPNAVVQIADLGKEYVTHGSVSQLYRLCGLDAAGLAEKMKGVIRHEN